MFETVFHAVPVVSIPVFCDHDSNAAKAELDGYALKMELSTITAESLLRAIRKLMHDPKFKREVKYRQALLRDQRETPLERAVYWTEYVLRHKGAIHLQSPAKDMGLVQYYLLDVILIMGVLLVFMYFIAKYLLKLIYRLLTTNMSLKIFKKSIKLD